MGEHYAALNHVHTVSVVRNHVLQRLHIDRNFAEFCDFEAMSCFGKEARLEAAA
jgi:hypothetical protein